MNDANFEGNSAKILVCDDDLMVRVLARECLEEAGMTVVEAEDGDAAISMFLVEQPDLIFLDVDMPGKTGFEVCKIIRGMPAGASVPILIATGADDRDSIDQGFNAGATQYKTKPVNWSLLSRDIRYMLRAADAFNEIRAKEDRLRYLAYFDHLTDLPNRRSFTEQLRKAMIDAEKTHAKTGLLVLNIDHFKRINDSIGHERGDQLLKNIAQRLTTHLGRIAPITSDPSLRRVQPIESMLTLDLARPGGDEFSVVVRNASSMEQLVQIGEAIINSLNDPVPVERHKLVVTPSVGMAIAPQHGADPEALLRHADAALHAAKLDGRGRIRIYDESLEDDAAEKLRLEADLREALETNTQLRMVYQPQIDTETGKVSGVEALLRWEHPFLGPISPARFIPVAESSGLIIPLGDWIFRRVHDDALAAGNAFPKSVAIGINLSPLQFTQSNFVENLNATLAELDVQYRIELELTEGVVMSDAKDSLKKLNQLKELGFDLAIDDFGTGYSSLSYLRNFPIDTLKIDRSFIMDIGTPDGDAIVRAILGMASALNLRVVAEGIETQQQAAFLAEHRCDCLQGYLFAKPLDVTDLLAATTLDYSSLLKPA